VKAFYTVAVLISLIAVAYAATRKDLVEVVSAAVFVIYFQLRDMQTDKRGA
jgi:lipid-A-disaccharide synthase-like uncharacterized protein